MVRMLLKSIVCAMLIINYLFAEIYSKVRITSLSSENIKKLIEAQLPVDDLIFNEKFSGDLVLKSSDINILKQTGIPHTVIIDDVVKDYLLRQQRDMDHRMQDMRILRDANITHYPYGTIGGYHRLDEMWNLLDSLQSKHPNLMSERKSIGKTHENRDIWYYKLSDNVDVDESSIEKSAYYDAQHHAREMCSAPALIFFTIWLLENYDTDPLAAHILNNREIFIVPLVNVDGIAFNEMNYPNGGGPWRKNKRINGDGSFGVDLNRNYSYGYAVGNGSSGNGNSETYHGPSAFSEPEVIAVRDFINEINPVTANIIHTKAGRYLVPYTYSDETPDYEIYSELTIGASDENNYLYGNCKQILDYYASGTTIDYLHSKGIYCWLPELGCSDFWAVKSEILPVAAENLKFNQMIALAAGSYPMYHSHTVKDLSLQGKKEIELNIKVKNRGFSDATENAVVKIATLSNGLLVKPSILTISDITSRSIKETAKPFVIDYSSIETVPSVLKVIVTVNEGNAPISLDTLEIPIGKSEILFVDNGDSGTVNWQSNIGGTWDTTSLTSFNGNIGFADTRNGNCFNNMNTTFTMRETISLQNSSNPYLIFAAKWSAEDSYDGTMIQVSTDNGSNWTTLSSTHTTKVNGMNGYSGANDWVEEVIDLSDYVGHNVKFRFKSTTNYNVAVDGFYFDEFRVVDLSDFQTVLKTETIARPTNLNVNITNGVIKLESSFKKFETLNLKVFNLNGRCVYKEKWYNKSGQLYKSIDMTNVLASGSYVALVDNGRGQVIKNFRFKK